MTEKRKALEFCKGLMSHLKADNTVIIRSLERRPIKNEFDMELKLVDGAMKTVGDTKIMGQAYELRLEVWNKEGR